MTTENNRQGNFRRGIFLLFFSAASFSLSLVLANKAIQAGTTPLTISLARYSISALLMVPFLIITGRTFKLPKDPGYVFFICILGFLVLGLTLTYVGSVQYIPVSLAVLIFYTNPFLVALVARALDGTPLTPLRLGAMAMAFLGLGLALEIWDAINLDWRGLALAAGASLTLTGIYIISGRAMRKVDSQTLSFHAFVVATVFAALATLLTGGPVWPTVDEGWLWLFLTAIFYAMGQSFVFAGIAEAGPVSSSLIMNMEPVFTIIFALLLLGERLHPVQSVGAALVIAAVFVVSRRPAKDPAGDGR